MGVAREYDNVRNYIRSLAGVESTSPRDTEIGSSDPMVEVRAVFKAPSHLTQRIFPITLEGLRNARKHAHARLVSIDATEAEENFVLTISDDGIGYPPEAAPPWTISSHVAEAVGRLHIDETHPAHLKIELPRL
jgi:signal transduction histidine kinase